MAIISRIGRKNWRVRLLFAGMYLFLILGGATMVYPLLLMLSGSSKSALDTKYFEVFPRFLGDDSWMWAKHCEGLFNERVFYLNISYDADLVSFEELAEKDKLEEKRELRCPECGDWFMFDFTRDQLPLADKKLKHEHQARCPQRGCRSEFTISHGALPGELEYDMLNEPNQKLVEDWYRFIEFWEKDIASREAEALKRDDNVNKHWLSTSAYFPGYVLTPNSRTISSGLREFKKFMRSYSKEIDPASEAVKQKRDYSDIAVVNHIIGANFTSWNAVNIPRMAAMNRRAVPNVSKYGSVLCEFFSRQPIGLRCYYSLHGYYKKNYLKPLYSDSLEEYNQKNDTKFVSWSEISLSRRYPDQASAQTRADWEDFVRNNLALEWIRFDDSVAPLYREMLRHRHGDIANMNRRYGGCNYASFDEVPSPQTAPSTGAARSDFNAFLQGYLEPSNNKLYVVPLQNIEICGLDFAYEDWVLSQYGGVAEAAHALGTEWQQASDIRMPQLDVHRSYFRDNIRALRWEFVTRNYKTVADYMLFHGRGIVNTIIYCGLAILTALLVNPLAAYAMSRYKMPSSYNILLFLMSTMAFPAMVTAIPSFIMLRSLGLLNTFAALILPGMANGYSIFLLKGFFDAQPQELYESAQLDGATEWVLFWNITMSLSKPILAVIALNAFTAAYSNFMFAFVICQDQKMWTMMVWLYQLQQNSGQAVMYASLVIAAIPTFLIFLFCQNIIMRGIVVPSEK
mgnify:CR=1 FL=1